MIQKSNILFLYFLVKVFLVIRICWLKTAIYMIIEKGENLLDTLNQDHDQIPIYFLVKSRMIIL